jgi:insertion element IS1 protein InsB
LWAFWFSLPCGYRKKLVYTDFYQAYAKLFAPWQHRPSAKGSGKTSIVEGLNNKWRNRVSGLVRKTVCVRYLQDLERRLWLVVDAHNQLCLIQLAKLSLSTE